MSDKFGNRYKEGRYTGTLCPSERVMKTSSYWIYDWIRIATPSLLAHSSSMLIFCLHTIYIHSVRDLMVNPQFIWSVS